MGWICLTTSIIFLFYVFRNFYDFVVNSYLEYFLYWLLPDFITQLMVIILSITFFIKSMKLKGRERMISIIVTLWCLVGLFVSLAWSFNAYFSYPISPMDLYYYRRLPGFLSTLLLLGTSIFLFVISFSMDNVKVLKKDLLIDTKIGSNTRKSILGESLTVNSLINSLNCIKCGSNVDLTSYKVTEKKITRFYGKYRLYATKYKVKSFEVPVCETCGALYNLWYSMHEKSSRVTFIGLLSISPCGVIFVIIFWSLLPWYINFTIVISFVLLLLKYRIYYTEKDSPFRNFKFKRRNRVFVRPDNFKKWISLQDWNLYNIKTKETGELHFSKIEKKFFNYLFENKGSAFSTSALIKRVIGGNFTKEYMNVISDLLKKMVKDEKINSDFQNGEYHYFYYSPNNLD